MRGFSLCGKPYLIVSHATRKVKSMQAENQTSELTDPAEYESVETVMAESVIHELTFSSHLEAGLMFCCFLIALITFIRKRLSASLLVSVGFLLVLLKYVIAYVTLSDSLVPNSLVTATMALGPVGLGLVAVGLYKQAADSVPNRQ